MLYFEKDLPFTFQRRILWWFCEFSLPRLCIRFFGLLSGYFEMHIVCGNITQGAAIPHFDGGCRGGENRQGHLDFGFLDSWILCWGLAAWETVKAHVRRSAAPLPLLLRNKCHPTTKDSAMCAELRLIQNIATGETSPAITSYHTYHFFGDFNFFNFHR